LLLIPLFLFALEIPLSYYCIVTQEPILSEGAPEVAVTLKSISTPQIKKTHDMAQIRRKWLV
jgi:hypothetical protein